MMNITPKPIFDLHMDYMQYTYRMQKNGLHISRKKHAAFCKKVGSEVDTARATLLEYVGPEFNPNSWQQILKYLSGEGIKLPNTKEETLLEHQGEHPFIDDLLKYRSVDHLYNTFGIGYGSRITKGDLLHSSYRLAETGRLRSRNPNLQNADPRVRPCFTPRYPGGFFLHSDLAGLEYRIIAHITQDPLLLDIFSQGKDIHNVVMELFGLEDRHEAKTANYAAVYGAGKAKFYALIGRKDPKLFKKVQKLYPRVNKWKRRFISRLYETGTVKTIFGRIREFDSVGRNEEREAVNWSIQSTGHDILMVYLMEVVDNLMEMGLSDCLLCNEVHDDFLLDCPKEQVTEAKATMVEIGKDLNPLISRSFGVDFSVPIYAEVEKLKYWQKT